MVMRPFVFIVQRFFFFFFSFSLLSATFLLSVRVGRQYALAVSIIVPRANSQPRTKCNLTVCFTWCVGHKGFSIDIAHNARHIHCAVVYTYRI